MKKKTLQLFITSNCNFKCKTCFGGFSRGNNMQFEMFCKAVDEAKQAGYGYITFTGGEPALHPQFKKMVEYVASKNMFFSFVSNGSLLHTYEFILDKYKGYLYVAGFSVDGATAEIHDLVRQKGSYDLVTKSITHFVLHGAKTILEVCLNKLNKHHIQLLFSLADKLNAQGISFSSAVDTGHNKQILLTERERVTCLLNIANIKKKYPKMPVTIVSGLQNNGGIAFCHALEEEGTLTVSPRGYYYFCTVTRFDSEQLGNVMENTLSDVIKKYRKVIFSLKTIRRKMLKTNLVPSNFNTCEFCNFILKKYYQEKYETK